MCRGGSVWVGGCRCTWTSVRSSVSRGVFVILCVLVSTSTDCVVLYVSVFWYSVVHVSVSQKVDVS